MKKVIIVVLVWLAVSLLAPLAGQTTKEYPVCGDSGVPGSIKLAEPHCGCTRVHNFPDFFREWFEYIPCPAKPEPVKPEPTKSKSEVVCISREAHWGGPGPAPPYCDNTAQNTVTFALPEDSPIGCDPRAIHPVGVRPSGELEDMCDHKIITSQPRQCVSAEHQVVCGEARVQVIDDMRGNDVLIIDIPSDAGQSGLKYTIHGDTLKAMRLLFRKMEEEPRDARPKD